MSIETVNGAFASDAARHASDIAGEEQVAAIIREVIPFKAFADALAKLEAQSE